MFMHGRKKKIQRKREMGEGEELWREKSERNDEIKREGEKEKMKSPAASFYYQRVRYQRPKSGAMLLKHIGNVKSHYHENEIYAILA